MRLFSDAKYRFIHRRRSAYVVSGVVILGGIVAMAVNVFTLGTWQNYGVDFTGGSLIQVTFDQPTTDSQVREALGGPAAPDITPFDQENAFIIRAPVGDQADVDATRAEIEGQLVAAFGEDAFRVDRTELVGPKIGSELEQKAAMAILFSFLLTLIYLGIRFEMRFGVAAVIATLHDIMVTLGFLAVFRVEIALPTVAALLTIIGYSLNDTIVVFDRIRENQNQKGARKEDPHELVNRSINETLPRTVLTSVTTLAVLVALLVLGPAVIRDFAIVLILGVVVGTYSSIFVASPALIEIRERWGEGRDKKAKPRPATV